MAKKTFVKELEEYIELHRCPRTGIAWVENGRSGQGHSAHPNIDASGSVTGMKKLGYWKKDARCVTTNGFTHNIDVLVDDEKWDKVAADACQCAACNERRDTSEDATDS